MEKGEKEEGSRHVCSSDKSLGDTKLINRRGFEYNFVLGDTLFQLPIPEPLDKHTTPEVYLLS